MRDTLKDLMTNPEWPLQLILSGIPELLLFFRHDRQLRRRLRFMFLTKLTPKEHAEFLEQALQHYAEGVKFKVGTEPGDDIIARLHTTPLVVLDKDLTPSLLHDWSRHVGKVLPQLARLVAVAETRPLTGLEAYVTMRLAHGPVRDGLLDALPLHVAITGCELFGAVATLGRMPNLKRLTDEEWRAAGRAGFDLLSGGHAGIDDFLEDLRRSYPYSRSGNEGPQAVFGRIYQVLEFGRADKAFGPLRDLVGNFIRMRFPVGPGDVVFGKPVERRTRHSIRTLSIETRLHPKRFRKLLEAENLPSEGSGDLVDGNCVFDAERGSSVALAASAATLSVLKAGEYLNAPRVQRNLLHRSGIIVPRIRGNGAADQFAPEDLDAFLAKLLDRDRPAGPRRQGAAEMEARWRARLHVPAARP